MMTAPDKAPDVEVTLTRILDAPRELVWKAWTDPKQMAQWWGPKGYTTPRLEMDVRRGGKILIHMRRPNGTVGTVTGVFREIDPPKRLVFSTAVLDDDSNIVLESLTIVSLEEQGEKTKLTVESVAMAVTAEGANIAKGWDEGWAQIVDRLADLVSA